MTLRDEIARELLKIDGLVPPVGDLSVKAAIGNDHCAEYLRRADRILALPQIADALYHREMKLGHS